MKFLKLISFIAIIATFTNCASGYKMIEPNKLNYTSFNEAKGVKFEYQYNLLEDKYEKKELKKGVQLVAIKITNKSGKDVVFGRDAFVTTMSGTKVRIIENQKAFQQLKQNSATYLLYLLLTPMTFDVTNTSSSGNIETNSTPIGLLIGPGLGIGNMVAAGSANKKFETELRKFDLNGQLIKNNETRYGLIGIQSNSFNALQISVN